MNECPICGSEMKTYQHVMDGWCIEEEGEECPRGHYRYTYAYGTGQWLIGDEEFTHHYTYSFKELRELNIQIAASIEKHGAVLRSSDGKDYKD